MLSCASVRRSAVRSVSDMLSSPGGTSAFTSDDDPQLVADSLPLALKLHEILLDQDTENAALAAATGRNYVMYSGAFVQIPAQMIEDEYWREADEARRRAKKLFRRGRKYLLQSLDMNHDDFLVTLETGDYDGAMAMLTEDDASTAYWAALAWLGMASTDPFDIELATTLDKAVLLLLRSLELDETNSGIHDVMIQVHLTLPSAVTAAMRDRSPVTAAFMDTYYDAAGVDKEPQNRAFYHYYRALSLSEGADASPHITMATAMSMKDQDVKGFRRYLNQALAIDPEAHPDRRLMTIIYQEKAQWLLDNIENFFLVDF